MPFYSRYSIIIKRKNEKKWEKGGTDTNCLETAVQKYISINYVLAMFANNTHHKIFKKYLILPFLKDYKILFDNNTITEPIL